MWSEEAKELIYNAISTLGIEASSISKDNYKRVWSRDAVMTGIVGVMLKDERIIQAFRQSLISLANHQTQYGQIPSNVYFDKDKGCQVASYGTLSGRVDATSWWMIGASIYSKLDPQFRSDYREKIYKALDVLTIWEMNNKGLLHTPLGGNWADEYPTHGYTLYDNVLRYWAVSLVAKIYNDDIKRDEALRIKKIIDVNFNPKSNDNSQMHLKAYERLKHKKYSYWLSSFSASGYDTKWDLAGNALMLLLNFDNATPVLDSLETIYKEFNHHMYPAFYPIIFESDREWDALSNYFNYDFKNKPYHFHNGGSWPIFLGWLCMALKLQNEFNIPMKIKRNYEELMSQYPDLKFSEYWDTKECKPHGTNQLCFSASGYLMMSEIDLNYTKDILF